MDDDSILQINNNNHKSNKTVHKAPKANIILLSLENLRFCYEASSIEKSIGYQL